MTERFGQRLRALRCATAAVDLQLPHLAGPSRAGTSPAPRATSRWSADGRLTINGLARLAHIDPSYVKHLEAGDRTPSLAVVERLSSALDCSSFERAMLLLSAGYWPWPDADEETTALLVALALAVLDGDYRPLEDHVRAVGP